MGEEVSENHLKPGDQPDLQLLLQAARFTLMLAAGGTREIHLLRLARQQTT